MRNIAFSEQVGFIKDSSKVIVFLKNINNYRDDECVEYKQLPFQELLNAEYYYYGKDNKLIARLIDIRIKEMIVNVLDVENNSVKKMRYPFKGISYSYPYTKDSIKSILEYYDRDSNNNLIYDSPFDNNGISMWYLESGQNTFAINSNVSLFSFKQFNNKKDLLLVRSPHEVSLWNIYSRKIIAEITNIKNLSDAQLSKQSNKLIVLTDDYAHVWEHNPLTFKQMLLRKLFNLYWQTSCSSLSVDSPERLLDAVVKKFKSDREMIREKQEAFSVFCLDKNELQEIWESFSKPIQNIIWQSIEKKIERYGK